MIRAALGDATSLVNIGAGSGSYEPTDLAVVPAEIAPGRVPDLASAIPRGAVGSGLVPDLLALEGEVQKVLDDLMRCLVTRRPLQALNKSFYTSIFSQVALGRPSGEVRRMPSSTE